MTPNRKKRSKGVGARPQAKRGGAPNPSGRGQRVRQDRPTDALPPLLDSEPESATAPALLEGPELEQLRNRLGLGPDVPDDQIRQALEVTQQHQYTGVPALLMAMAQIDEHRGTDLLGDYSRSVEKAQEHEQEMDRSDRKVLRFAMFTGQGLIALIFGGGVVASVVAPDAAVPIMGAASGISAALAAPRLIEAFKGRPSDDPKADEPPPARSELPPGEN